MTVISIEGILNAAAEKWGSRNFIYSKENGGFSPRTFGRTVSDVRALAAGLIDAGLYNRHILIYGENSYEWAVCDLAVMGFAGVTVAANKEWKENDLENVINISDAECIIYSNSKTEIINSLRKKYNIKYISMQDDFAQLLKTGYEILNEKNVLKKRNTDEMCKIVFTSGTTSSSKAVMLSGKNLFFGFESLRRRAPMDETDKVYLFLPLSHTYGGIYNFLSCLYFGMELYLCSDTDKIFEEIKEVKPTIFSAVPLIYERVYSALSEEIIKQVQMKNEICIQEIKEIFGGSVRCFFCGGAPYDTSIRKFYKDAGLNIMEAYALTETASSLAIEYAGSSSVTSSGTIFEDIEVKFADTDENGHGEILVRGGNVALGYYKNEEETKKAFDEDGYFHTGDIGYKDEKNQLFLIGRKRRVIVFSNAENIYPDELEELLIHNAGVAKAKVFEKDRKITAVLYIKHGTDAEKIINETNELLPDYKQIKSYEAVEDSVNIRLK